MTWTRSGDPATPSKTSAHRDHFAYVRERYGNPLNVQRFWEPPHTDDHAKTLAARLSHVQWIAATVLEGAQSLLTHAQLREEELIENLVKAKNACDETAAPAEAVLAAARLVEELEQHIENLSVIVADTTTLESGDES